MSESLRLVFGEVQKDLCDDFVTGGGENFHEMIIKMYIKRLRDMLEKEADADTKTFMQGMIKSLRELQGIRQHIIDVKKNA